MIDYKPSLVKELQKCGLPVYYELFVDSSTKLPCLTYIETNNSSHLEGDNLFYSNLSYNIKLWGDNLKQISPTVDKVNDIMRQLGFTRTAYNELAVGAQLCLILSYSSIGWERK